jgi:lysophospholipase L1-like esterase
MTTTRVRPSIIATLLLAGTIIGLLTGELALRIGGFRFQTFPTVQFGWPEPWAIDNVYTPDQDVFWVTRDYGEVLGSARRAHPAVMFMGDSTTQFGAYPRLTMERLAACGSRFTSGVKVGVGGWSTEQGLAQLRRDVLPLHPRVVTILYGWNDHWLAYGRPDAEARPGRLWFWLSQHSRLAQLVLKVRFAIASRASKSQMRVELPRYRENLATMVHLVHDAGSQVVLITAPSDHVPGQEPQYLALRHVKRLSDVVPLHRAYVEATRQVAAAEGAVVCDAAAAFDALGPARRQHFVQDGIHLSEAGDRVLANLLADCIERAATEPVEGAALHEPKSPGGHQAR